MHLIELKAHVLLLIICTCFWGEALAQSAGDLLITEFMANPDAVNDDSGEYLELYNTTGASIDIDGYVLSDDGSNSHTISGTVIIASKGFVILANSTDPAGDVSITPDYVYSSFTLTNSSDEIIISSGGTEITRLDYTDGDPFGAGVAAELDNISSAIGGIIDEADLIAATETYGLGDRGSPGSAGNTVTTVTVKSEPSGHATSFSATGVINSVNLSWTDAAGVTVPDTYLIRVSSVGYASISNPSDGNFIPNDIDLSDDNGALNVANDEESASFSGLSETTTYYFKIYPYTNSGSDIDYKTDGSIPQAEATTLNTPDIIINEILADPDGATGDANGDGYIDTDDDEFIEFVNIGANDIDVSGWVFSDNSTDRYTFPESTILKPLQAAVIFGGGTPTGDFGSSFVDSTSSLGLNNTGETITLKNDSGVEIIRFTYGSEANSNESISRNPDLTGDFEQHETADTSDASSFSPGTRIDGSTFQPSVEITGSEGWRILSTPVANTSYSDLLEILWTQGIATGADVSSGDSNVRIYDGSSFISVNDLTVNMTQGTGFITYVFSDDDFDGSADGFPKILEVFAVPNSGAINPALNSGANAWTLVGNPYASTIDWDDLGKTDLTETVYVYDHSYGTPSGDDIEASGSAGGYRVWNGTTGSLMDGLIAPFQGFWVQNSASATSEELNIEEADKKTGGTFYKSSNNSGITIKLLGITDRSYSECYLSFTESGELNKDNDDGLKLSPLDFRDYLSVSTLAGNTKLDINNLPTDFEDEIIISVTVDHFAADAESGSWVSKAGEVTLSWPVMENLPEDWSVALTDFETGTIINMRTTKEYAFTLDGETQQKKSAPSSTILRPQTPQPERLTKGMEGVRFRITITRRKATNNEPESAPKGFSLEQNYPNPFNPTTSIEYSVAQDGPVAITVYNMMGQQVANLVSEMKAAGTYRVNWDAENMASGIYHYRLQSASRVLTRQMTLIK